MSLSYKLAFPEQQLRGVSAQREDVHVRQVSEKVQEERGVDSLLK